LNKKAIGGLAACEGVDAEGAKQQDKFKTVESRRMNGEWRLSLRCLAAAGRTGILLCSLACIPILLYAVPSSESAATASGPDADVKAFQLGQLEAALRTMQPGPERNYFEGVLANRAGRIDESIRLLNSALPSIREANRARAAVALETLADDYNKSFRYADAASTYDDLLVHFADQLSGEELQGSKDDAGVAHLLREAPAQSIAWQGPTRLKTERDTIDSLVTELTVNGVREKWLLDTGANLSVVSRSFAKRLGLQPLPGYGQTMSGLTGIENPLQVALVPVLQMGGATLRNVVALILDDANLNIKLPKKSYQISGIIGYPVFQAMGAITFLHDGFFEAGSLAQRTTTGTRMYMRLLMPVIECEKEGIDLPFTFDTGASGTILSARYYKQFQDEAGQWKEGENATAGGGGMVRRKVYLQPKLELKVGNRVATIRNVPIFPTEVGSDKDDLYGNLGQDFVAGFESFTVDFSTMTFSLGAPLTDQEKH
jgi:predicted aspartyl protease